MLGRPARPAVAPGALQARSRLDTAERRRAELIALIAVSRSRGTELPRLGCAGGQFNPAWRAPRLVMGQGGPFQPHLVISTSLATSDQSIAPGKARSRVSAASCMHSGRPSRTTLSSPSYWSLHHQAEVMDFLPKKNKKGTMRSSSDPFVSLPALAGARHRLDPTSLSRERDVLAIASPPLPTPHSLPVQWASPRPCDLDRSAWPEWTEWRRN